MKDINKTSKLIFDMRLVRKLLKMNGELKFCPYCGKPLTEKCGCHNNMIIDVKPMRDSENATVAVFANTESFQKDFDSVITEFKEKNESKKEEVTTKSDG